MTPMDNLREKVDRIEAQIMDWFYETVRINFDVDMVQDASDLRAILDKVFQEERERVKRLIGDEIADCHTKGEPTSRLTRLYLSINK